MWKLDLSVCASTFIVYRVNRILPSHKSLSERTTFVHWARCSRCYSIQIGIYYVYLLCVCVFAKKSLRRLIITACTLCTCELATGFGFTSPITQIELNIREILSINTKTYRKIKNVSSGTILLQYWHLNFESK